MGEAFEPRRYDLVANRHPSALYPFSAAFPGTGANFAIRRSAVNDLGGFDPILGTGGPGRGGEDLDWFLASSSPAAGSAIAIIAGLAPASLGRGRTRRADYLMATD